MATAVTMPSATSCSLRRKGILPKNPFQTIDRDGVGRLMAMAVEEGRKTRPTWKLASAVSTAAIPPRSSSAI
jgi:hypothetical protein